jgi:hypothetical protein
MDAMLAGTLLDEFIDALAQQEREQQLAALELDYNSGALK